MKLLFMMSARNLLRHRGRSLVVGIILFLGAMVMTVGNAVLSGMERGLRENIREGFLGDVVVASSNQKSDNILFGVMGRGIAPLQRYPDIRAVLDTIPTLKAFAPVGKNMAVTLNEDGGNPSYSYLLGVDWDSYRKVFPNRLVAREGVASPPDLTRPWALVPDHVREQAFDQMGVWFVPSGAGIVESTLTATAKEHRSMLSRRDEMVLMGFSDENASTDVRLPVEGIVHYPALNNIWGWFVLVDIESYRRCQGYLEAREIVQLDSSRRQLLDASSQQLDALFGDPEAMEGAGSTPSVPVPTSAAAPGPDRAAWNLVLVRLKPGQDAEVGVSRINAALTKAKLPARAILWSDAAGPVGGMAIIIKGALFVFVGLLFVVAAIIVMNTLSMAAMERASEIGMMRAVGASRNFIRGLFAGETILLAAVFGGAGILSGGLVVLLLRVLNLSTENDILQMVYGGQTFRPLLTWVDWLLALVQLTGTSVTALLYPMGQAARIPPLEAIRRD